MHIETEVKIKIDNIEQVRQRLLEMNAELFKKRALQTDIYIDDGRQRKKDKTVRIRDNSILTYKGPAQKKKNIRSNEEIEVMVDNGSNLFQLLEKIGFKQYWKKERYRECYLYKLTQICIDETPIGNFIEIKLYVK